MLQEKEMSSIPNSTMPHAGPSPEAETEAGTGSEESFGVMLKERAGKFASSAADLVRENPKTAVAAGAALLAGAVAAAAIPTVRSRRSAGGKSGSGKSTSAKRTTAKSSGGGSTSGSRPKKS
jgi:hypothetical protein